MLKLAFGDVLIVKGTREGEGVEVNIWARKVFYIILLNLYENMKNQIILAHEKNYKHQRKGFINVTHVLFINIFIT